MDWHVQDVTLPCSFRTFRLHVQLVLATLMQRFLSGVTVAKLIYVQLPRIWTTILLFPRWDS
jgi:hypothetical protein